MNDKHRPPSAVRMAAINALHEAEAAGRPISGRADAVIAALGLGGAVEPEPAELQHALQRTLEALERRLKDVPANDPDHLVARAARAALGLEPPAP